MEEIVAMFFDGSYEVSINKEMLEYDYAFPTAELEDYVLSVIATPYKSFIDYVHEHICPVRFDNSSQVPQISSYDLSTFGVCKMLNAIEDPGVSYLDLGRFLYPSDKKNTKFDDIYNYPESHIKDFANKNGRCVSSSAKEYLCLDGKIRNKGAITKIAENQVKGACFHGLVYQLGDKWFLTCLGRVYSTLDEEFQHSLSARTLLRAPLFWKVIGGSVDHDIDIIPFIKSVCKGSTIERRRSSCMHFFDICANQAKIEGCNIHKIFASKDKTV